MTDLKNSTIQQTRPLTKKDIEMYESVMQRKMSKEELLETHKQATKSFEQLDREELERNYKKGIRIMGVMILLFITYLILHFTGVIKW